MAIAPYTDTPYTIEQAHLADAEEMTALINEAYKTDAFREGARTTKERVIASLNDKNYSWYVIRAENALTRVKEVAYTIMYSSDTAPITKDQGHIHLLAAHEAYRGRKGGHVLLDHVEKQAQKEGLTSIRLIAVQAHTLLCSFYKKCGYEPNGKTFSLPNAFVKQEYRNPEEPSQVLYIEMEKMLASAPSVI